VSFTRPKRERVKKYRQCFERVVVSQLPRSLLLDNCCLLIFPCPFCWPFLLVASPPSSRPFISHFLSPASSASSSCCRPASLFVQRDRNVSGHPPDTLRPRSELVLVALPLLEAPSNLVSELPAYPDATYRYAPVSQHDEALRLILPCTASPQCFSFHDSSKYRDYLIAVSDSLYLGRAPSLALLISSWSSASRHSAILSRSSTCERVSYH